MKNRTWIRFDCNTGSVLPENEQSDCDSNEHSEHSLGYNVQLNSEAMDEDEFNHVYDN